MCTAQMSAWDGNARHIEQRAAFAMVARSPIERILQWGTQRGWRSLALFSDPSGDYTRDYVSAEDADMPGYKVLEAVAKVVAARRSRWVVGESAE